MLTYRPAILRTARKALDMGLSLPDDAWEQSPLAPTDNGFPLIPDQRFYRTNFAWAIMDHIEDPSLLYFTRLDLFTTSTPHWHEVSLYEEELSLVSEEAAYDLDKAISVIQEHHNEPLTVKPVSGGGLVLRESSGDELRVAVINPIDFQPYQDGGAVTQMAKDLRKANTALSRSGLNQLFRHLLEMDPQPHATAPRQDEDEGPVEYGGRNYIPVASLAGIVLSMRKAWACMGVPIKQGHAQELTAAFFNTQSWNHLRGLETKLHRKGISLDPVKIGCRDLETWAPIGEQLYYASPAQALCALRERLDPKMDIDVDITSTYGSVMVSQCSQGVELVMESMRHFLRDPFS